MPIDLSQVKWDDNPVTPEDLKFEQNAMGSRAPIQPEKIDLSQVKWDEAPKPDALSEFGSGVVEGSPVGVAKAAYQLVRHPIDTTKALIQSHIDEANKTLEEFGKLKETTKEGLKAAGDLDIGGVLKNEAKAWLGTQRLSARALGTIVPVIGPGMADTAVGISEGDPRSIGQGVGMLGTAGASALLKAGGKIRGVPGGNAADPIMPRTPIQAGETGMAAKVEALTRKVTGGASSYDWLYTNKQLPALRNLAETTVKKISDFTGTAEDMGQLWKQAQDTAYKVARGERRASYETLKPAIEAGGTKAMPFTDGLKKLATEIGAEMDANADLIKTPGGSQLRNQLAILEDPKLPARVSWDVMKNFRSTLQKSVRAVKDISPGVAEGITSRFEAAADEAMGAAAKRGGFYDQWKAVDTDYKAFKADWNKTVLGKIAKANPSQVPALLSRAPIEDLRVAARTLPPDVIRASAGHMIEEMITGSKNMGTGTISGEALAGKIRGFGQERLKVLAGKEGAENLNGLAKYAHDIGVTSVEGQNSMWQRLGSSANTALLLGTIGGAYFKGIPGAMTGAMLYLAPKLMADSIVARPGISRLAVTMAKAMETTGKAGGKLNDPKLRIPAIALSRALTAQYKADKPRYDAILAGVKGYGEAPSPPPSPDASLTGVGPSAAPEPSPAP